MAVLVLVAIALLHCARSGELFNVVTGSMSIVFASRISGVLTYVVMAILFYKHPPKSASILYVAIVCMLLYFASLATMDVMVIGFKPVLIYTATLLYGIAVALYRLYFFSFISLYSPRVSASMLCAALLAGNVMLLLMAHVHGEVAEAIRICSLVACTLIVISIAFLQAKGTGSPLAVKMESEEQLPAKDKRRWSFPANITDWAFLLVAAAIFHNLFGIIAQASSQEGLYFALYDASTSFILVVINAALLVFLWFYGGKFDFGQAVVIITVLYATGFAFYSFAWDTGSPIAGALIRSGFQCSTILMWSFMARKSYMNHSRTYFYFSLFLIVSSVYPGRLLGSILAILAPSRANLLYGISTAALWLICAFGLFVFFVSYSRMSKDKDAEASSATNAGMASSSSESNGEGAVGEGVSEEDLSYTKRMNAFAEEHGLSQREKDVMVAILHGKSRVAIAEMFYLSPETIKTYITRIYRKAGVSSKQELIALVEGSEAQSKNAEVSVKGAEK